ncbi:hypothetical protein Tco_1321318 [Tanacetum coccineum]
MQDHRIDAQDSLIAALTAQVSSLQGHLATALGEIRALQARDQARADAPEGTASTAVGLVFSFLVSDNHRYSFLLEDLEAVPADYVPAGHILISADRYRIC